MSYVIEWKCVLDVPAVLIVAFSSYCVFFVKFCLGSEWPIRLQAAVSGCRSKSIPEDIYSVLPGLHWTWTEKRWTGKAGETESDSSPRLLIVAVHMQRVYGASVANTPLWAWCYSSLPLITLLPHFLIFCSFLLFPLSFFYSLYRFYSFVHFFPFYQNHPTPFPGRSL